MNAKQAREELKEIIETAKLTEKVTGCSPKRVESLTYALEAIELLDDWRYEMAYYTKEDVATPKGVKEFIGGFFDRLDVGKIKEFLLNMNFFWTEEPIDYCKIAQAIVACVTKGETPKVK